ncbi:MAG: roadblock/LC7 domain-containing protein [candidate division WOR-3 bacterium]
MIAAELEKVLDDIKRFVPETLGVIVASDEGLPIAHVISKALSIQDSIVIAGLLSSATAMVQNVLNEFGDRDFQMVFVQGGEISILVGVIEGFYIGFITTANVKLGPLFMEFKKQREKIYEIVKAYM